MWFSLMDYDSPLDAYDDAGFCLDELEAIYCSFYALDMTVSNTEDLWATLMAYRDRVQALNTDPNENEAGQPAGYEWPRTPCVRGG